MSQRKPPKRNRSNRPQPPLSQRANLGGESIRIHPGVTMRFYRCGTLWHMTSVDADFMAELRKQQEQA